MSHPNPPYEPGRVPAWPTAPQQPAGQPPASQTYRTGYTAMNLQPPAKRRRRWPYAVGTFVAALALCGIGAAFVSSGGSDEPSTPAAAATTDAAKAPATTKAAAKPAEPKLTAEQRQAVGKAQDYLRVTHFSRSGLIDQLKHAGFGKTDATVAVDSLKADWNAQAVGKAKDYLRVTHFSRSGLIEQLEHAGFTAAQAKHGATGAGL